MSKSSAGKGDRPRPYDHKKWEAGWAAYEEGRKRELSEREKEKQDQGLSTEETYLQVRDNLGLPNTPELCDINGIQSLGCDLPAARDGCKECTIGRLKNEHNRQS